MSRSRTPSLSHSQGTASSRNSPDPYYEENDYSRHQPTKEPARSVHKSSKHSQKTQPPAHFMISFVRECFCVELGKVDFTQALKSLDYLKAVDDRRKREFSSALRRLNVDTSTWDFEKDELKEKKPEIYRWIASKEDKARRLEALYTQVFIGIRRWILINEFRLTPFNRRNCTAMLTTLYPEDAIAPTPQLTTAILASQKAAFVRYLDAVERSGRTVLRTLEQESARPGEPNGWPVIREIIAKYLDSTESLIGSLASLTGPEKLAPPQPAVLVQEPPRGRADSSVTDPNWRPQRPLPINQTHSTPNIPAHAKSLSQTLPQTPPRHSSTPPNQRPSSARPPSRPGVGRSSTSPAQPQTTPHLNTTPHHERKGSAIGRWARRFKNLSTDETDDETWGPKRGRRSGSSRRSTSATPSARSGSATPSHERSNSSMGMEEDRARTPLEGASGNTFERGASIERNGAGQGLGLSCLPVQTIDDEYRARLIAEAKAAKEEREAKRVAQAVATHFKLESERRGLHRKNSNYSYNMDAASEKGPRVEPEVYAGDSEDREMYRGRTRPRVYRMKADGRWNPSHAKDNDGGAFVAELEA